MNFLKLTLRSGKVMLINMDHVLGIETREDGVLLIFSFELKGGLGLRFKESQSEIIVKLRTSKMSKKYTGMKVSVDNLLGTIKDGWEITKDTRYLCGQLCKHLQELGREYYAGNVTVVDKFLQRYRLDKGRLEQ